MFVIGSSGTQPYIYVYPFSPEWLLRRHGEESTCQWRRCKKLVFDPWVRKRPSSRKWQPTPVSLPVPFHGQRSLAGYSPWRFQKPDRTQRWTRLLLQTPLPPRLPHNIEQSSLCYTVGPCWLPILNISVCHVHSKLPNSPFPTPFIWAIISSFSKSVSLFPFCK